MVALLLALLLALACASDKEPTPQIASETKAAEPASEPIEEPPPATLGDLMFHYYEAPAPQHIAWMIQVVSHDKLLENRETVPPIQGFLTGAFIRNPEHGEEWAKLIANLPAYDQSQLWTAVWLSGEPAAREVMKIELERRPAFFKLLLPLLAQEPPDPAELPLTSEAVLDYFWGAFFATGDTRYLLRISIPFAWDPDELAEMRDTRRQSLRDNAAWSFRSNASAHRAVLVWCEQEINSAKGFRALELQAVIEYARSAPQVTTQPDAAAP
jgi:hypothetical protein